MDVQVLDVEDNQPLSDINVVLSSGLTASKWISSQVSDNSGMSKFSQVAFDYYTVGFKGDDKYLPASKSFQMTKDKSVDVILFLHKRDSTTVIIEENVYNVGN